MCRRRSQLEAVFYFHQSVHPDQYITWHNITNHFYQSTGSIDIISQVVLGQSRHRTRRSARDEMGLARKSALERLRLLQVCLQQWLQGVH